MICLDLASLIIILNMTVMQFYSTKAHILRCPFGMLNYHKIKKKNQYFRNEFFLNIYLVVL